MYIFFELLSHVVCISLPADLLAEAFRLNESQVEALCTSSSSGAMRCQHVARISDKLIVGSPFICFCGSDGCRCVRTRITRVSFHAAYFVFDAPCITICIYHIHICISISISYCGDIHNDNINIYCFYIQYGSIIINILNINCIYTFKNHLDFGTYAFRFLLI